MNLITPAPALSRRRVLGAAIASGAALAAPAFAVDIPAGQSLGIASVPNLRDIGGYPTIDGKVVRRGAAYRSEKLNPVSPGDLSRIAALDLKCVFDLRTAPERQARPDIVPSGVPDVWLDVLGDAPNGIPANIIDLLKEPKKANAVLGDGKLAAFAAQTYRQFVSLPSARLAYGRLFTNLGAPGGACSPALFHCTAGKDRTGWAAAALLTHLGVSKTLVFQDYLRTNDYILPEYKPYIDHFITGGGDPSIAYDLFGAKPEYLQTAFDEVNLRYGSMDRYLSHGLGIDANGRERLRSQFLQTA